MAFDLACVAGLWLAGRRLRGPAFGLLLAYLWVTFPFTLLVANSGTNDALVGALVLAAFLCTARPVARGALAVIAGPDEVRAARARPVVRHRGRAAGCAARSRRAAAGVLVMAPVALGDGLGTFADRTLGFQGERKSPFSIWGLYDLPGWLQVGGDASPPAALAVAVAFVPSRRDDVTVAALGAAVLIALQLARGALVLPLPRLVPAAAADRAAHAGSGRRICSIAVARPVDPRSGPAPR